MESTAQPLNPEDVDVELDGVLSDPGAEPDVPAASDDVHVATSGEPETKTGTADEAAVSPAIPEAAARPTAESKGAESKTTATPAAAPVAAAPVKAKLQEPTSWLEEKLPVLYWKDPVQTGLICGLGCCVYLLYHVRGYSVLSLVSLVLLFNLAANATFILLCATPLKPMLLKDGEDSRDRLITLEHLVQSALESKQTSGLVQVASQAVEKAAASLRDDLACPSIIAGLRAFTSLSLMYVVGCLFSLETVLFIGFLALFSAPALYARNSSIVDAQMAKITAQINEQAETLVAKAYKSAPQLKTVVDFVTKQRAGPKVKES